MPLGLTTPIPVITTRADMLCNQMYSESQRLQPHGSHQLRQSIAGLGGSTHPRARVSARPYGSSGNAVGAILPQSGMTVHNPRSGLNRIPNCVFYLRTSRNGHRLALVKGVKGRTEGGVPMFAGTILAICVLWILLSLLVVYRAAEGKEEY